MRTKHYSLYFSKYDCIIYLLANLKEKKKQKNKATPTIIPIHIVSKHKTAFLTFLARTPQSTYYFTQSDKAKWKVVYKNMSTAVIMPSFVSLYVWVLQCAGQAYWKGLIDGFTVDCLSTSLTDETCQCKDTWMQQPVLHFLLLSSSSLVRGRENDAVNTDAVCTVILGPAAFYLPWQLLLLSKSNARAWGKS